MACPHADDRGHGFSDRRCAMRKLFPLPHPGNGEPKSHRATPLCSLVSWCLRGDFLSTINRVWEEMRFTQQEVNWGKAAGKHGEEAGENPYVTWNSRT
jgi:hypothetical protein